MKVAFVFWICVMSLLCSELLYSVNGEDFATPYTNNPPYRAPYADGPYETNTTQYPQPYIDPEKYINSHYMIPKDEFFNPHLYYYRRIGFWNISNSSVRYYLEAYTELWAVHDRKNLYLSCSFSCLNYSDYTFLNVGIITQLDYPPKKLGVSITNKNNSKSDELSVRARFVVENRADVYINGTNYTLTFLNVYLTILNIDKFSGERTRFLEEENADTWVLCIYLSLFNLPPPEQSIQDIWVDKWIHYLNTIDIPLTLLDYYTGMSWKDVFFLHLGADIVADIIIVILLVVIVLKMKRSEKQLLKPKFVVWRGHGAYKKIKQKLEEKK